MSAGNDVLAAKKMARLILGLVLFQVIIVAAFASVLGVALGWFPWSVALIAFLFWVGIFLSGMILRLLVERRRNRRGDQDQ